MKRTRSPGGEPSCEIDHDALEMACTPGNVQVSTYLDSKDYAILRRMAQLDDRTLSAYLRKLVADHIARKEEQRVAAGKVVPFFHRRRS